MLYVLRMQTAARAHLLQTFRSPGLLWIPSFQPFPVCRRLDRHRRACPLWVSFPAFLALR